MRGSLWRILTNPDLFSSPRGWNLPRSVSMMEHLRLLPVKKTFANIILVVSLIAFFKLKEEEIFFRRVYP